MLQSSISGPPVSAHDERNITAVLISYATAIDTRDWAKLPDCFTPDCDADYGAFGHWTSASAITAFIREVHAPVGPTLHRISNIEITMLGDGAQVRSYVDALLMPKMAGGPIQRGIGYYLDQFVLTGQGWKIARRQFKAVHME